MDMFPVVCALLSFVLIGPSDAKVVTLELGSAIKGERRNFNATCNGTCKGVSAIVTPLSGFAHLYGANDSIPHPGYCDNCFCRVKNVCQNISFEGSSSFAISVVAYTDYLNATLTIEALNLEKTTEFIFPSKRLNLGSPKKGNRKDFRVTCSGPCEQLTAFVKGKSGGCPILYGAENSLPDVDDDKRCYNCFCESVAPWWINICRYLSFETSSSLIFSVIALTEYENGFFNVEASNLKNLEEIVTSSQDLNLGSSIVGRNNFYVTCDGACSQVKVRTLSGNPQLFFAKNSIPFLQWSGGDRGSLGCKYCLNEVNDKDFKDSTSFSLSVIALKPSDTVKVEAVNIRDIEEISFPSKTVNIGFLGKDQGKTFQFTCYGHCKQVSAFVTSSSGIPQWFLAKQKPGVGAGGLCSNCFCSTFGIPIRNTCISHSLDDSKSFYVYVKGYNDVNDAKLTVAAFNLKDLTENIIV